MSQKVSSFNIADPKFSKRYKSAGIPKNFWACTFKDFTMDSGVSVLVKKYIAKFPEMLSSNIGLSLFGASGTGKSMLAAIIGMYVSTYYAKTVKWVQLDDLIYYLNKSWVSDEDRDMFLTLVQVPTLLILDDFPKTSNQSKDISKLSHRILRDRLESGKPLIVTTSYTESNLSTVLGSDIVKELFELSPKIEITSKDNFRDSIHKKKLTTLKGLLKDDN